MEFIARSFPNKGKSCLRSCRLIAANNDQIVVSFYTNCDQPALAMFVRSNGNQMPWPKIHNRRVWEMYEKRITEMTDEQLKEELLFQYNEFLNESSGNQQPPEKKVTQEDLDIARMDSESPASAVHAAA